MRHNFNLIRICPIHTLKFTWTYSDGKIRNEINHSLIDKRWHSSVLYARSFRASHCDTGLSLVVARMRERLAETKLIKRKFLMKWFNLKKLNEVEDK
jgi:hypothetical protein